MTMTLGWEQLTPAALKAIAALLLLAGSISFIILVKGAFVLRRIARDTPRDDTLPLLKSRLTPAVSVILAPTGCGAEARDLTHRLLRLSFSNHEVVVALRAATEEGLAAWREEFHLQPSPRPIDGGPNTAKVRQSFEARLPLRLLVLDLEAAPMAAALNVAVKASQSPVIALFGEDCEFDTGSLLRLMRRMVDDPQRTIAVCGAAPGEPGAGIAQQFAALDFLRSWLSRAAAFSDWNLVTPPGGSALLVSREALAKAGGFRRGRLELFLDLHKAFRRARQPYRIAFAPGAGCVRRAPRSKAEIRRAAAADFREAARCAAAHGAFPAWLRAGLILMQFLWPILEAAAYVLTIAGLYKHWIDWQLAVLMLLTTFGLGTLLSMSAVALRELAEYDGSDPGRLARLFIAAFIENLGFRQFRSVRWIFAWGE